MSLASERIFLGKSSFSGSFPTATERERERRKRLREALLTLRSLLCPFLSFSLSLSIHTRARAHARVLFLPLKRLDCSFSLSLHPKKKQGKTSFKGQRHHRPPSPGLRSRTDSMGLHQLAFSGRGWSSRPDLTLFTETSCNFYFVAARLELKFRPPDHFMRQATSNVLSVITTNAVY